MGMFDEIRCHYPLEDAPDFVKPGHAFQTKDLECQLLHYELSDSGALMYEGQPEEYTGAIDFYSSNINGYSGGVVFTSDGRDAESVEYHAEFVKGKLQTISQTSRDRRVALPMSEFPSRQKVDVEMPDPPSSFVGAQLYLAWGGRPASDGYPVQCVAEHERQLCLIGKKGMEMLDAWSWGAILFDSQETAIAIEAARKKIDDETAAKLKVKLAASQKNLDTAPAAD